jgi:precorrin-2 dehydrogenase/sirohydrochlorin ferrochelatase
MFPVLFDPAHVRAVVVGHGRGALRRLASLEAAGVDDIKVFAAAPDDDLAARAGDRLSRRLPESADLKGANLVLAAGLDDDVAERLAATARALGIPVNVEDRTALCDFHMPATIRRGDLLLTASTGGRAPGLARAIREHLGELFGPEWSERLDILAEARQTWRDSGADPAEVSRLTQELIDREGWFG